MTRSCCWWGGGFACGYVSVKNAPPAARVMFGYIGAAVGLLAVLTNRVLVLAEDVHDNTRKLRRLCATVERLERGEHCSECRSFAWGPGHWHKLSRDLGLPGLSFQHFRALQHLLGELHHPSCSEYASWIRDAKVLLGLLQTNTRLAEVEPGQAPPTQPYAT